jgi:iron complex outermembrane receptor protein
MDIEVTSVAKKHQRMADTAAAIYVITREEIRRTGVPTLAEVLRLAPGATVSRVAIDYRQSSNLCADFAIFRSSTS